jgi:hypothetical protein
MRTVSRRLKVGHINHVIDIDGKSGEFFDLQFTNPFFTANIDSAASTMEVTIAAI